MTARPVIRSVSNYSSTTLVMSDTIALPVPVPVSTLRQSSETLPAAPRETLLCLPFAPVASASCPEWILRCDCISHRPAMNLRAMGAVGEVSWETPGKCGSALEFYSVGTDPQTLQTPAIAFGNAVTLSVWVFVHTSGATTSANGGRNFTSNQEIYDRAFFSEMDCL